MVFGRALLQFHDGPLCTASLSDGCRHGLITGVYQPLAVEFKGEKFTSCTKGTIMMKAAATNAQPLLKEVLQKKIIVISNFCIEPFGCFTTGVLLYKDRVFFKALTLLYYTFNYERI